MKTATGWIKPDDGFLVLGRNGNGQIDDGTGMFGDSTPLDSGEDTAADGFAALAQEDSNADGVVDANDARWSELRVWRDLNQDGVSQADELFTLEALGIIGLNVVKEANTTVLPNGNVIADLGTFIRSDGTEGIFGEVTVNFAGVTAGTPEYDAWMEKLNLLERFNGRPFANPPEGNDPFTLNLSSAQMTLLDRGHQSLKQSVYDGLLLQTRLEPYLSAVELVITEGGIALDFGAMNAVFTERHDTAPAEAVRDFLDLHRLSGEPLTGFGWDGLEMLRTWAVADATDAEVLAALAEFGYSGIRLGVAGTGASELVVGQEGADTLSGNGGVGNDWLEASPAIAANWQ